MCWGVYQCITHAHTHSSVYIKMFGGTAIKASTSPSAHLSTRALFRPTAYILYVTMTREWLKARRILAAELCKYLKSAMRLPEHEVIRARVIYTHTYTYT